MRAIAMGEAGSPEGRPASRGPLSPAELVDAGLAEDLGARGDITSELFVPADRVARAAIISREPGVLAGREPAEIVFERLGVTAEWHLSDGDPLAAGTVVATLEGLARRLLGAERTALNFLCRLSGIATLTAAYVAACAPVAVLDTRKTTPGWRALEKAAVAAGGGTNHRMGLDDMFLVKDNHLAIAGSGLAEAVAAARARYPGIPLEVEADDLVGAERAAAAGVDWILLDNMDPQGLRAAVAAVAGRAKLEASGQMNLERAAAAARTGVDAISVGALTHSAPTLDLGLDVTT